METELTGKKLSLSTWLARELKANRKLFPDLLPFILDGALVGAGSLWPQMLG
jgi:hypothetical protein